MKKSFLILFAAFIATVSTAFASPGADVNEKIEASFKKEFAGSRLLGWSQQGEYMKATFILAGCRTEAYFTEDGTLQGSIRGLFYNQLPLAVITTVDKRFDSPDVIDVCEISNSSGTIYRITLEASDKKYRVRTDADGNITDVEKLKN